MLSVDNEHFILSLSLRFYVKTILENLEVRKMLFFSDLKALNFDMGKRSSEKITFHEKYKFRASKCVQMAVLDLYIKLISREN